MNATKICRICGIEKPLSGFRFRNDSKKYRNECKDCCNRHSADYRRTHKAQIAELNKRYDEEHKAELAEYSKNYQKHHLDKFREYNKKHRENMTEEQRQRLNEREKIYREPRKNDPAYLEKRRIWDRNSTKRRRKEITAYEQKRKQNDPVFKLKKQIRNEIRASFNRRGLRKSKHTEEIIGCSTEFLCKHLYETYLKRYGIEYDGKEPVHIDHIKPLSNAKTEQDVIKLCHFSNLQLLKAEDNLYKNDNESYLPLLQYSVSETQKTSS